MTTTLFLTKVVRSTLVRFPLTKLDLSRYQSEHCKFSNAPSSAVYDLVAVSNHFGGLGGGHYTAFGRTSSDEKSWAEFDDSSAKYCSADHVVSSAAYVLFYNRKVYASWKIYILIKRVRNIIIIVCLRCIACCITSLILIHFFRFWNASCLYGIEVFELWLDQILWRTSAFTIRQEKNVQANVRWVSRYSLVELALVTNRIGSRRRVVNVS